ncbi:MAG: hypothetical protein CMM25_02835 [Rhodospirillaceae bacterium]|nr:hypothetical protein [Rhodospirillaceae bacterium]|tara:strand:- start:261 stop:563 length:303 start_codon:yes stop_codon:yes gene_type:complete
MEPPSSAELMNVMVGIKNEVQDLKMVIKNDVLKKKPKPATAAVCKGFLKNGKACSSKAVDNEFCGRHQKQCPVKIPALPIYSVTPLHIDSKLLNHRQLKE